jgi:chromosome segregation ATPase
MQIIPYGSPPPPRPLPTDVSTLQQIVLSQQDQMEVARGDITRLKDLARRLNTKFETEQKRLRQVQEQIVLANAHARNLSLQNEDMRERMWQLEAHGVEQRHVHTVRLKQPPEGMAVIIVGIAAIIGMFALLLYAIAQTVN